MSPLSCYLQSQQRSVDLRAGSELPALFAQLSCPSMEIRVPFIEGFLLRHEIALEIRLTFGNDAPTVGIFIERYCRYFFAMTIAQNGFVRGHEHVPFLPKF